MALLKITTEDIKKATPPSAGWHLCNIGKFVSKKREAPKEGYEYSFPLEVVKSNPDVQDADGNVGRQSTVTFYSTGMGFMIPFVSAVLEMPITEQTEFDPEKFEGKQVMAEMVDGVYNGKPTKKWTNFAPASGCPF